MAKVIIAVPRDYTDKEFIFLKLLELEILYHDGKDWEEIIVGGTKGMDLSLIHIYLKCQEKNMNLKQ